MNADIYKVRDGDIAARSIATKQLASHASPSGGTHEVMLDRIVSSRH